MSKDDEALLLEFDTSKEKLNTRLEEGQQKMTAIRERIDANTISQTELRKHIDVSSG